MKKHDNTSMKKHALIFLHVASIIALTSCNSKSDSPGVDEVLKESSVGNMYNLTATQFTSSEMQLGKLEMKTFHEIVKANGMFDVPPQSRATVSTYFGGTIKHIQLLPGERVKKGQILFTLENPEYVQVQQEYLEAKGQLPYLKSDFERQKNLNQDNITSQKKYLKSESDYTVARVKLEAFSRKLTLMGINPGGLTMENIRTTIDVTSPISGYVTEVNVSSGAFLTPSQTAVSIVNTDHLHLELKIFEKDHPKVEIGQSIKFKSQTSNLKEYQASVHLVNKTVDPKDRTIGIHGHLINERLAAKFNPGMYVEADIFTSTESRVALPMDAIVEVDGKYYVLMLSTSSPEGYAFIKKEVTVGSTNNGYAEVLNTNDFKDNSEILVKGAFNLIKE